MKRLIVDYTHCESLANVQAQLLRNTVNYVYQHSSYYKKRFDSINIDIHSIKSMDDLLMLPIITKLELLENNEDFFCCRIPEAADIVTTSGSTGLNPIIHPLTYGDLCRLSYNEKLSFEISNIDKNDHVLLTTALDGSFVAGLAYYLGLKEIGTSVIRAGSKNMFMQADVINRYNITAIVGVPSNLIKLYRYMQNNHYDGANQITKLVLIGESIRNRDFTLNQLGIRLSKCFPYARLYSTYANTETCTSFCECSAGKGGHLLPNLAFVEIVDDGGFRVKDGELGRVIITTFGAQGMPLLRYDTGDISFLNSEKCECGRISQRLGPIISRAHNISKIGGITFSQAQLENVILSCAMVEDYCIIVQTDEDNIQSVKIYVTSYDHNTKELISLIKQKVWNFVRISVEVEYSSWEDLKKKQNSNNTRKPLRFIYENTVK